MTESSEKDGAGGSRTRLFIGLFLGTLLLVILALGAKPLMGIIGAYLADRAVQKVERRLDQSDLEALEYARSDIEVEGVTVEWFEDVIHGRTAAFRGTLKNKGDKSVESMSIHVRFMGETGEVIGEDEAVVFVSGGFANLEPPLMPGDEHTFAMSLSQAPRTWQEEHGVEWTISLARFFVPRNQSPGGSSSR